MFLQLNIGNIRFDQDSQKGCLISILGCSMIKQQLWVTAYNAQRLLDVQFIAEYRLVCKPWTKMNICKESKPAFNQCMNNRFYKCGPVNQNTQIRREIHSHDLSRWYINRYSLIFFCEKKWVHLDIVSLLPFNSVLEDEVPQKNFTIPLFQEKF